MGYKDPIDGGVIIALRIQFGYGLVNGSTSGFVRIFFTEYLVKWMLIRYSMYQVVLSRH